MKVLTNSEELEYELVSGSGVDITQQPFVLITEAVRAYEHGNSELRHLHPTLTLEHYIAVALDLALIIKYGGV
jgi:hypothetical protein